MDQEKKSHHEEIMGCLGQRKRSPLGSLSMTTHGGVFVLGGLTAVAVGTESHLQSGIKSHPDLSSSFEVAGMPQTLLTRAHTTST